MEKPSDEPAQERESTLTLSISGLVPTKVASGIIADLQKDVLDIQVVHRGKPGPQAGLEVLMATPIILWFAEKYLGAMVGQIGKEHFERLRKACGTLWRQMFANTGDTKFAIITAQGVKKTLFSTSYSASAKSKYGGRVTLVFRDEVTDEDFALAHELFWRLMSQHLVADGTDQLTHLSNTVPVVPYPPERRNDVVFFNAATRRLEYLDVVSTARTNHVVSIALTI